MPSIAIGQVLGTYRLIERIARGSQGEVFRAHDERFDKDVALKILPLKALADEDARKRFRQGALAVGRLNHPNVATALYFGEENGVDFLVTEYVAGTGLDEKLAQGPMPEEDVVALGIQLASGLEAAHRERIIHRDLKPGNLRISQNGSLKILDFGLAELVDSTIDVAPAETMTTNITLTGTLPYTAPEQFGGVSDQRTDLWSAGAVLYEMATGQLPFAETQLHELRDAILRKDPPRPTVLNPKISRGLESVILRCLQKDPNRRYQTAAQLRDDLARVAGARSVNIGDGLYGRSFAAALLAIALASSAVAVHHFWPRIKTLLGKPSDGSTSQSRVLAVLPVESDDQSAAENALVRGVAETVSARIAQGTNGHSLQLISANELSALGVETADAAKRELNVDRVLAVGLQRSGDRMRITYSLINPKTHQQMDARVVIGDAKDLFGLEDIAAADVFAMLPPDAKAEPPLRSEVHATSPAGYESYVRGRGYLQDYQKPENIDAAIKQFEQALKVSPNYAPAYAGLAEAYRQGYKADRGTDWLDKARVNCEKALAVNPRLAEGLACLGNLYVDVKGGLDLATAALESEVRNLQKGKLAFDVPPTMTQGKQERAEVRIARGDNKGAEQNLKDKMRTTAQVEDIEVASFMIVKLHDADGSTFEITPLTEDRQSVAGDVYSKWAWIVTPLRSGQQTLYLSVGTRFKLPNSNEETRFVPIYEKKISVQVDRIYETKHFLSGNWQWLTATLVIPLIGFIWHRRKKKGKETELLP